MQLEAEVKVVARMRKSMMKSAPTAAEGCIGLVVERGGGAAVVAAVGAVIGAAVLRLRARPRRTRSARRRRGASRHRNLRRDRAAAPKPQSLQRRQQRRAAHSSALDLPRCRLADVKHYHKPLRRGRTPPFDALKQMDPAARRRAAATTTRARVRPVGADMVWLGGWTAPSPPSRTAASRMVRAERREALQWTAHQVVRDARPARPPDRERDAGSSR